MAGIKLQQIAIWYLCLAPMSMLPVNDNVENEWATLYFRETNITFDWRTHGVISAVAAQGATTRAWDEVIGESIESLNAIQTGKLLHLSTDESQDCCPFETLQCVVKLGGLCLAEDYKNGTGKCQSGFCPIAAKVTSWNKLPLNREDLMVKAIHNTPIMAGVDASSVSFMDYTSGILDDTNCGVQTSHYVQLVGYGSQDGNDFWIAKNSWGSVWGMQGYMYISRGKNMCGIANNASYPVNN